MITLKMAIHLIVFLHIVCALLTDAFVLNTTFPAQSYESEFRDDAVCQTEGCKKAASDLLENMDQSANPCDDFFQFACGGYVSKKTIPEDKPSVGTFTDVQENLNRQIKGLLEKPLTGSEPKFVKMLKDMYDSCMDESAIQSAGGKPMEDILTELGGWPVVKGANWDESKFDWMKTLISMRKLGLSHKILFDLFVFEDLRNNTFYSILLDQAILGMPDRSYLIKGLEDPATAAYFNMMKKFATKLGADAATAETELKAALDFETELAKFALPDDERRDFSKFYNKYTITGMQTFAPQVNWVEYMNGLFEEPIEGSQSVIIIVPDFVQKTAELIGRTNKRVLANYMMWRVVLQSSKYLSKDWTDLHQEYNLAVEGSNEDKARWDKCLSSFSETMIVAYSYHYVTSYFQTESKTKTLEVLKYMRKEFMDMLEKVDWMDESTKAKAIEKANAITAYVAYPDELLNETLVAAHYKTLTISKDNYFNNILHLRKWETDYEFSKLKEPNLKGDWRKHVYSAMADAFFNPMENTIDIPAGILQMSFFNKDRPYYMNFGGVGYVIGHELTHGFDDVGRQFDKDGNNINWWDDTTDKLFKEKAQCIIDQYSSYTVLDGKKVNGISTQGENIADNGGMKEAYRAYQIWVKEHGAEPKLPGLNYTPNQIFWLSAANIWCVKYRPEFLKLSLVSDPHSPSQFRVLGPMSNLVEFSEAFNCPAGSKMNPEKKCKVW